MQRVNVGPNVILFLLSFMTRKFENTTSYEAKIFE